MFRLNKTAIIRLQLYDFLSIFLKREAWKWLSRAAEICSLFITVIKLCVWTVPLFVRTVFWLIYFPIPPTPKPPSPALQFIYAQVRPTGECLTNYVAILWVEVCQPFCILSNDKSISTMERPEGLFPRVSSFVLTTRWLSFFHFGSELYPEN